MNAASPPSEREEPILCHKKPSHPGTLLDFLGRQTEKTLFGVLIDLGHESYLVRSLGVVPLIDRYLIDPQRDIRCHCMYASRSDGLL
jgi:hypothetical protein